MTNTNSNSVAPLYFILVTSDGAPVLNQVVAGQPAATLYTSQEQASEAAKFIKTPTVIIAYDPSK